MIMSAFRAAHDLLCKISWLSLAKSGSFGGMLRSKQRNDLFIRKLTARAMTPAMSISKFSVRSRWSKERASGRNSAMAIAPAEESEVLLRKRLRVEGGSQYRPARRMARTLTASDSS